MNINGRKAAQQQVAARFLIDPVKITSSTPSSVIQGLHTVCVPHPFVLLVRIGCAPLFSFRPSPLGLAGKLKLNVIIISIAGGPSFSFFNSSGGKIKSEIKKKKSKIINTKILK